MVEKMSIYSVIAKIGAKLSLKIGAKTAAKSVLKVTFSSLRGRIGTALGRIGSKVLSKIGLKAMLTGGLGIAGIWGISQAVEWIQKITGLSQDDSLMLLLAAIGIAGATVVYLAIKRRRR